MWVFKKAGSSLSGYYKTRGSFPDENLRCTWHYRIGLKRPILSLHGPGFDLSDFFLGDHVERNVW